MCPVTMCPYLGNEETGSPWTGEHNGECETSCGWYQDGHCIGGSELGEELYRELDVDESEEWPACSRADECQWQNQMPDGMPCPPRMKVMSNTEMGEAFL